MLVGDRLASSDSCVAVLFGLSLFCFVLFYWSQLEGTAMIFMEPLSFPLLHRLERKMLTLIPSLIFPVSEGRFLLRCLLLSVHVMSR